MAPIYQNAPPAQRTGADQEVTFRRSPWDFGAFHAETGSDLTARALLGSTGRLACAMVTPMSGTLAAASKPLLLELHETLRAVDPARWRDDAAATLREKLCVLRERISSLLATDGDPTIRERLSTLAELLGSHLPESSAAERWMDFRSKIAPAYEGLVAALKAHAVDVPSLRPTNYTRSIFHVLNGIVALLVIELVPRDYLIYPAVCAAISVWFMEGIRRISPAANARIMRVFGPVAHPYEQHGINSGTWYVTALLVLAIMKEPMLGAVGVAILSFADPAAALVGRRFGTINLVNGRSLEGTTTFFFVGWLAAFGLLALLHTEVLLVHAILLSGIAAMVGALAELFSRRIDDNLSIPLTAAAAGSLVLALLAQ